MSEGGAPRPEIAYERLGTGPPLLLVHGLGGTSAIWRPQQERLAAERDVIAVDMPGFGDSPPLPSGQRPTPAALGAALTALCRSLGVQRPHVAGNSLGGWVALEMARAGDAASLCLISPAGLWRRPLGPRSVNTRGIAKALRPVLYPLVRTAGGRARLLRTTVGHPERLAPGDAVELMRAWIDAPGYEGANAEMRAGVFEDPGSIDVPTMIAWGEFDRLVAPPRPERRPPGARFIVLEDCGHTPNWDRPERIAELLLEASSDPAGDADAERVA